MNLEPEFKHTSVLLKETVEGLNVTENGIYVDGTLGGGGHAYEVCRQLSAQGRYIGIDQDEDAIAAAGRRLSEFSDRVILRRENYRNMKQMIQKLGFLTVNGILLDLGVSSYQLDTPERGFSYRQDAPLDMRMDNRQERTAKDIVNTYEEHELYRIIRDYGEDKFAKNIAKHIVRMRTEKPIETTMELCQAVDAAIPAKFKTRGNPAKRTFQAIRIELNQELDVLKETIGDFIDMLQDKGRLCIITFHSLEDRIVKECFRKAERPCTCPPEFPVCICNKKPSGVQITRKPITASKEELEQNSRAKSAKLRIFERQVR